MGKKIDKIMAWIADQLPWMLLAIVLVAICSYDWMTLLIP